MEFFRKQTNINFISLRKIAYGLSLAAMIISVASVALRGMNMGLDFTGGTLVEIAFPGPVTTQQISQELEKTGLDHFTLQHFGSNRELLLRIPPSVKSDPTKLDQQILGALHQSGNAGAEIRRKEFVGPQVGQELVEQGGLAVLLALLGIGIYIWFRFERRFAIGAMIATVHDPLLTLGFFSLTGIQFDLSVLAAALAIIGYSVNDTIVVFDRIRDNLRKMRKATPSAVVNLSINETLSRTVMTSATTLLVVLAMFFLGGPELYGFSLALILGILVGTYSSIYVASTVALDLGMNRSDIMPKDKETGAPLDEAP